MKTKVACVVGTRPEAVKMAPVINSLRSAGEAFDTAVISTGQHGSMLSEVFEFFEIQPDVSLDLMVPNQSLWDLTARASQQLGSHFHRTRPDWVLVQGDTASAFVAAYCAFLAGCKVGHVEAGLRTYRKHSPFPEEVNRKLIAGVADLHFAPTQRALDALRAEGIGAASTYLTGNTIVDALKMAGDILRERKIALPAVLSTNGARRKRVLVTAHRRENHQAGLANICEALRRFVAEFSEYQVIFQVHPNPSVKSLVSSQLNKVSGVTLIDPQPYGTFIQLMMASEFILTDSGGIQEEGPSLGKPVLVAREDTERPEGISAGCNELVGTGCESILQGLRSLVLDRDKFTRMSEVRNPFGDGRSAERIVELLGTR